MIRPLTLLLTLVLVAGSPAKPVKKDGVTHLDPTDAVKVLAVKDPAKKPILLDVRTPGEFKRGRIADSTNVNLDGDDFEAQLAKLDKTKPYLVLCHSGGRSTYSLATLKKLGFTRLYHLDGGIAAWMKAGLPVTK